jgi:hypothetical protein
MSSPDVYGLVNVNDSTGWIDTMNSVSPFGFHMILSGTISVVTEVAMDSISQSDAQIANTYTASGVPQQYSQPIPRFIRFRKASGSGTGTVSIWPGIDATGRRIVMRPVSSSNKPSSDFS